MVLFDFIEIELEVCVELL